VRNIKTILRENGQKIPLSWYDPDGYPTRSQLAELADWRDGIHVVEVSFINDSEQNVAVVTCPSRKTTLVITTGNSEIKEYPCGEELGE
jgi:hypothetical protein